MSWSKRRFDCLYFVAVSQLCLCPFVPFFFTILCFGRKELLGERYQPPSPSSERESPENINASWVWACDCRCLPTSSPASAAGPPASACQLLSTSLRTAVRHLQPANPSYTSSSRPAAAHHPSSTPAPTRRLSFPAHRPATSNLPLCQR